MARQLGYTPPTPPDSQARAELDDLVEALHDAGLLRARAGGARSYPDILRLLLRSVDAQTLRSLVALSAAATDLDPAGTERVARGVRRARQAAPRAARGRPPGLLRLGWRMRRKDTRRGLAAAIAALAALGSALGEDEPTGPDVRHPS